VKPQEQRWNDDALDDELEDDQELSARLRALFDPSADLRDRTASDVDRTLRGRSILATGLDLLGLGLWTTRALLSDPASPADQEQEGN
jgi:hypothetical protein